MISNTVLNSYILTLILLMTYLAAHSVTLFASSRISSFIFLFSFYREILNRTLIINICADLDYKSQVTSKRKCFGETAGNRFRKVE